MRGDAYIKEDYVTVSISIMSINAIKSLWKLHIAYSLPDQRVHHETHCFSQSFAVVDVVITIQVQKIRRIC